MASTDPGGKKRGVGKSAVGRTAGKTTGEKTAAGKTTAGKAPSEKPVRAAPVDRDPAGGGSSGEKIVKARSMTLAQVRGFIEALAAANPEPATELDYATPYTLLVAVVLSAQATDVSVNRATRTLFADAPTPDAMVLLGVEGVGRHIRSIGLWQGKARNVVELSRLLLERHGGEVPRDREALEALPGVGRKTANVVLNIAFNEATMAVDTHIFRLGNRTGLAPGASVRAVEDGLVKRIPPDLLRPSHHWLILHGRYVCKARRPECWRCVAAEWCQYPDKNPGPGQSGETVRPAVIVPVRKKPS